MANILLAVWHVPAIKGAVLVGGSAFLVDLHAWSESPDGTPYNVKKAMKRVISAVTGGAAIGQIVL